MSDNTKRRYRDIERIQKLNKAACKKLGHVHYFTGTDARVTLSAMFAALVQPPVNAVLWADAGQTLDPLMLRRLRRWRNNRPVNTDTKLPYSHRDFNSYDVTKKCISDLFDTYAKLTPTKSHKTAFMALEYLHNHIQNRILALQQTIPATLLNVYLHPDLPAHLGKEDKERDIDLHTDGHGAHKRTLRILEPIDSEGTIICDNRDFNFTDRECHDFDPPILIKSEKYSRQSIPVAYQAPPNSLLLISNDLHHSPPIVHCAPAENLNRPGSLQREIICYDLVTPIDWYKTFKP